MNRYRLTKHSQQGPSHRAFPASPTSAIREGFGWFKQCTVWAQVTGALYWLELSGASPIIYLTEKCRALLLIADITAVRRLTHDCGSEYRDIYLVYVRHDDLKACGVCFTTTSTRAFVNRTKRVLENTDEGGCVISFITGLACVR